MQTERHYERLCRLVAAVDPLLLEAVGDVDLSLLEWALQLSPWERLRVSAEALAFLSSFERVGHEAS